MNLRSEDPFTVGRRRLADGPPLQLGRYAPGTHDRYEKYESEALSL